MTPGSIPELVMHRRVFVEKTLYACFPLRTNSLPAVVAQPVTKDLKQSPKKRYALVWLDIHRVPGSNNERYHKACYII